MTDQSNINPLSADSVVGLNKRYRRERIYKNLGLGAITLSLAFLAFLIISISYKGMASFQRTEIQFNIEASWVTEANGNALTILKRLVKETLPNVTGRKARREANGLLGANAEDELNATLKGFGSEIPPTFTLWLPSSDNMDMAFKGGLVSLEEGDQQGLSKRQQTWALFLAEEDHLQKSFSLGFLTNGDSRDAERAGIGGALLGSMFTLGICLVLSFVIGTMAAIYLEEFSRKNMWTSFLEVNINNLASVPSIIFGLLGLAIFLNTFGMPRSSSLVGGLVLFLMTLPTVIITSRVALQSVPPSIREAALGLGATKIQTIFHHVIPLAMPGMLTGTIIGMAQALGETAPLLMIGMVAFIADVPTSVVEPAAALPVQIFLWADASERAFLEKTSAAIIVLIVFLVLMNLLAIFLRKKFEKRKLIL